MYRGRLLSLTTLLTAGAMVLASGNVVHAIKPFQVEFEAKYVKKDSDDAKHRAFAAAVKKAKCNSCHEGKKKKNLNAYGKALAQLLDKKKDKKDVEKIRAAINKVASMNFTADDASSPTFEALIELGKLPGGEP